MNARRAIGGWLVRLGQRIARPTITEVPVNWGIARDIATTEQLIQDVYTNPDPDEAARSMDEWKRRWLARAGRFPEADPRPIIDEMNRRSRVYAQEYLQRRESRGWN